MQSAEVKLIVIFSLFIVLSGLTKTFRILFGISHGCVFVNIQFYWVYISSTLPSQPMQM